MANRSGSILIADFGSTHTRVSLIDVVDGVYRVVAHGMGMTTNIAPNDDLTIGLALIVNQFESIIGRKLLNQAGNIIVPEDKERNGVDLFVTTTSSGRPLRAVMVSLIPEISLESAYRAISGNYIEAVANINLRDGLDQEGRLNAMLKQRPDLVFITGGTEKGARSAMMPLLEAVQLMLKITDPLARPAIVYAGNSALVDTVSKMFDELTKVYIASNIHPKVDEEQFESVTVELSKAYDHHRESQNDAFASIGAMSSTGILPTAQGYQLVAQYIQKMQGGNTLVVDMGSTSSVLVGAFDEQYDVHISTLIGMGYSAELLYNEVGDELIESWLPFYPKPSELHNYAVNKSLRSGTIPMSQRDLYIEHAFVRAGLRRMVHDARHQWRGVKKTGILPPVQTIIVGGSTLTGTGYPAFDMMLLADGLQPSGVSRVWADTKGIIPALGALAQHNPAAAIHLLDGDALESVGTLISFEGHANFNKGVAKLKIETQDGDKIDYELKGGHLLSLPLPEGFTLKLDIRCAGGIKINGKSRLKVTVEGGTGGILLDGRGRTFYAPEQIAQRAQWMPIWNQEVTDAELLPIPEEWLVKPVEAVAETTSGKADKSAKSAKKEKAPKKEKASKKGKQKESEGESDDFFAMIEAESALEGDANIPEAEDEELDDLRKLL